MITFKTVRVRDVLPDMVSLLHAHFDEVGHQKGRNPLDPDYDKYMALDDAGLLSVVVAYNTNNHLIGYCVDLMMNHLHHKTLSYAVNDVLYVRPEYRRTAVPLELLNYTGEHLTRLGISVHIIHMKMYKKFQRLAEAAGYDPHEISYLKYLGA